MSGLRFLTCSQKLQNNEQKISSLQKKYTTLLAIEQPCLKHATLNLSNCPKMINPKINKAPKKHNRANS